MAKLGNIGKIFLVCFTCMSGCEKISDKNQAYATTRASLTKWGETIGVLAHFGIDLHTFSSTEEILAANATAGMIDSTSRRYMQKDYWGRPFWWKVYDKGQDTVVSVGSVGRNGIFEAGSGDDIYVEVTVSPGGEAKMRFPREERQGPSWVSMLRYVLLGIVIYLFYVSVKKKTRRKRDIRV